MMLQNLFIFPTREESFGLVVPEAGMLGCLMVLNKSLQMQFEVSGYTALMADFGSFHQAFVPENEAEYLEEIARVIVGKFNAETALISKTFYRRRYNMDAVYRKDYAPALGDAITWNAYAPQER